MAMVASILAAYRRAYMAQASRVCPWVGSRLALLYIHRVNRMNSRNGPAVITAPKHCYHFWYYYYYYHCHYHYHYSMKHADSEPPLRITGLIIVFFKLVSMRSMLCHNQFIIH